MIHPVIIGAGGVASYLLPVLLKTFKPQALTIIDKDVLEERNLDRQLFDGGDIGKNKASALARLYNDEFGAHSSNQDGPKVITEWFTDATTLDDTVDAIICVADNHEARYAAILRADALGIMCYLGGNEYFDSEAYAYHRNWKGTPKDPLVRYPNIATDHRGSPINCQGEAQEASPQLAIANLSCAAKLLHLMWVYEQWLPENKHLITEGSKDLLPYELVSSLFTNTQLP